MADRVRRGWRLRDGIVIAVLAVAFAVNVASFRSTDDSAPFAWRAWGVSESHDVFVEGLPPNDRDSPRFYPQLAVGYAAPESTVLITGPDRNLWGRLAQRFAGVGQAHVEWILGDDIVVDRGVLSEGVVVASGAGGPKGPAWTLVVESDRAGALEAERVADTYVPRALAGDDVWTSDAPLTLVLVRVPDGADGHDFQFAIVEVSLLDSIGEERITPWLSNS